MRSGLKINYVLLAGMILLLGMLGARELWTQEHRWADIVSSMFYYHDYLHPMLDGREYYDKPLLSYWLIVAVSYLLGELNTWALRLPSALGGLLALWSIYRLGIFMHSKRLGILAAWMMLTTYYFVFWARVSSADMLNLAGALFGVVWYVEHRERTDLFSYTVFFIILSLTASCKGLVGPIITLLAILPDMIHGQHFRKHFNANFFIAMIPALFIYVIPFWMSSHYSVHHYQQNGLYQVYRENLMRYFQPFDHKGPIYTYFIYLPVYLLPWTLFFIPAFFSLKARWKNLNTQTRWMVWATCLIFLFFTLSGSRRSYYILPLIPYVLLLTAEWILNDDARLKWARFTAAISLSFLCLTFMVLQPLYYAHSGLKMFDNQVKATASQIKPWSEWNVVLLDAETKLTFYMHLPPNTPNLDTKESGPRSIDSDVRRKVILTRENLLQSWPILLQQPKDTIFITKRMYVPIIADLMKDYRMVEAAPTYFEEWFHKSNANGAVAFIPNNLL